MLGKDGVQNSNPVCCTTFGHILTVTTGFIAISTTSHPCNINSSTYLLLQCRFGSLILSSYFCSWHNFFSKQNFGLECGVECGLHSKNIVGVTSGLHSINCNGLECGLHSESSGVRNALS